MSRHTPGPWFVEQDQKTPIYVSPVNRYEQVCICNVCPIDEDDSESGDFLNGDQTKANAKLIAAAPDLLKALEGVDRLCSHSGYVGVNGQYLKVVRAAIAKAKGEFA